MDVPPPRAPVPAPAGPVGPARSKQLRQQTTWLLKTPLLANNLYDKTHQYTKESIETQHVAKVKAAQERGGKIEARQPKTLAEKIQAIERSFDEAETIDINTLEHPTNPKRAETDWRTPLFYWRGAVDGVSVAVISSNAIAAPFAARTSTE